MTGQKIDTSEVKVSIIIPHYNQINCLQNLLPAIAAQTYKNFKIIIIDDCTPDYSVISFLHDFIRDRNNMRLVRNSVNMRFVKTCNKGIKMAEGEYICLLNSDTEPDKTFIQRNVEILDSDNTIGGLTCVITDQDGETWFSGGRYKNGMPANMTDEFQGIRPSDFIAGTAVFYRKKIFDDIGLLDEKYIMYHEDIEFGLRVKRYAGYRLCVFSEKLVKHLLVPSIPKSDLWYYDSRNLLLIARKYLPKGIPRVIAHIIYVVCVHTARALARLVMCNFTQAKYFVGIVFAAIKGTIDGLTTRQTESLL